MNNFSFSHSESRSPLRNGIRSLRSKSKSAHTHDPSSSPESTVFCIRSSDSSSSHHHHRNARRPPNPSTQTTPTEYVNKLANLFTKNFSNPPSFKSPSPTRENHISTQTYDTVSSSSYHSNHLQTSKTEDNLCLKSPEQVRKNFFSKRIDRYWVYFSQSRNVSMTFRLLLNVQRNVLLHHLSNIKNLERKMAERLNRYHRIEKRKMKKKSMKKLFTLKVTIIYPKMMGLANSVLLFHSIIVQLQLSFLPNQAIRLHQQKHPFLPFVHRRHQRIPMELIPILAQH